MGSKRQVVWCHSKHDTSMIQGCTIPLKKFEHIAGSFGMIPCAYQQVVE